MDNKQDRQFYWEVKDFMTKNPEVTSASNNKPKTQINSNNFNSNDPFGSLSGRPSQKK